MIKNTSPTKVWDFSRVFVMPERNSGIFGLKSGVSFLSMKKGMTEFSWIFSLIIGSMIIFLAVYSAQKFVDTTSFQSGAEIVREFDVLLNPFASVGTIATISLSKQIDLPVEMRLNFSCNSRDNYQELNARIKSGKNWGKWLPQGYKIRDKYVFSDNIQGKKIDIFSKPLLMPWRVDDLIYMTSKSYCFDGAPEDIEMEIKSINSDMIFVKTDSCPSDSVEVCFGSRSCDVNVNYALGVVKKGSQSMMFYDDSLMYAAIFSDQKTYDCNLDRLLDRLKTQVDINIAKSVMLQERGCETSGLQGRLGLMKSAIGEKLTGNFQSVMKEVDASNPNECPVFD